MNGNQFINVDLGYNYACYKCKYKTGFVTVDYSMNIVSLDLWLCYCNSWCLNNFNSSFLHLTQQQISASGMMLIFTNYVKNIMKINES